jgi:hypothetical protein
MELKANLLNKVRMELPTEIAEMIFAAADNINILEENEVANKGEVILSYLKIEVMQNTCDGYQEHKEEQLYIIEFKREYIVDTKTVVKSENILEGDEVVFTSIAESKYLNI